MILKLQFMNTSWKSYKMVEQSLEDCSEPIIRGESVAGARLETRKLKFNVKIWQANKKDIL